MGSLSGFSQFRTRDQIGGDTSTLEDSAGCLGHCQHQSTSGITGEIFIAIYSILRMVGVPVGEGSFPLGREVSRWGGEFPVEEGSLPLGGEVSR